MDPYLYKIRYLQRAVQSYFPSNSLRLARVTKRHQKGSDLAVILHLYYPEMWEMFRERLRTIPENYDLFVTVPKSKYEEVKNIVNDSTVFTTIIPFTNRGRDILPFLATLKIINKLGYKKILKLHSKKSTHRLDGKEWSDGMVKNLLPAPGMVKKVLTILDKPKTGLVGPAGEYLQLSVNFEANGMYMTQILNKLYSKEASYKVLQVERSAHGFFAGSMFWARTDALQSLLSTRFTNESFFDKEKGQVDATFAHALERVFTLMSEIEGRTIYEVSPRGCKVIDYKTDNIPDWSSVYKGPQA